MHLSEPVMCWEAGSAWKALGRENEGGQCSEIRCFLPLLPLTPCVLTFWCHRAYRGKQGLEMPPSLQTELLSALYSSAGNTSYSFGWHRGGCRGQSDWAPWAFSQYLVRDSHNRTFPPLLYLGRQLPWAEIKGLKNTNRNQAENLVTRNVPVQPKVLCHEYSCCLMETIGQVTSIGPGLEIHIWKIKLGFTASKVISGNRLQ